MKHMYVVSKLPSLIEARVDLHFPDAFAWSTIFIGRIIDWTWVKRAKYRRRYFEAEKRKEVVRQKVEG